MINAGENKMTRAGRYVQQPAGANQLVSRLVDVGVLSEITGYARNRRFRFEPYVQLFEEPKDGQT
jgi:hypothetical protein